MVVTSHNPNPIYCRECVYQVRRCWVVMHIKTSLSRDHTICDDDDNAQDLQALALLYVLRHPIPSIHFWGYVHRLVPI